MERCGCRLFRFRERLAGTRVRIKRKAGVCVCQSGVERSKLRIFLDSLAEVRKRKIQLVLVALIERIAALEIEVIGLGVGARALSRRWRDFQPDSDRDRMRHFLFESEYVVQVPLESF